MREIDSPKIRRTGTKGYMHPSLLQNQKKVDILPKDIDPSLLKKQKKVDNPVIFNMPVVQNQKKVDISPKFDIYSIFVCIAQLEYGLSIIDFEVNDELDFYDQLGIEANFETCFDNYTLECHEDFLKKIYKKHCKKMKIKNKKEGLKELKEIAYNKNIECVELICVIFRELRMTVEEIDDAPTAFLRLNVIYQKLLKDIQEKNKGNEKILI